MTELPLITAATVQFQHQANNKQYNLLVIERFIEQAALKNIKILAFPEMCITGYWHVPKLTAAQVTALAEPIESSPSLALVRALALKHQMLIGVGLIGVRLENGNYPTLRLFFVQCGIGCA